MSALISVIIPVYNNEKYIERCISSICTNTYEELDIIIINDGSTDGSKNMCDKMETSDSRIRVFHRENSGVSYSRNFGMSVALGEYITFIDSDDYVDRDYFYELLTTIKNGNSDLSLGSIAHIYGETIDRKELNDCSINLDQPDDIACKNFFELNKAFFLYGPVNKLYKKQIIQENHIAFPEDTSYGEDLLFNFEYLKYCRKIEFRNLPVYYYDHSNDSSLSHRYRGDLFENGLRLNKTIIDFSKSHQLYTKALESYCAHRIYDDAYNALFTLWKEQCPFTVKEKYAKIQFIMKHPYVQRAAQIGEYPDYPHYYNKMLKGGHVLLFFTMRYVLHYLSFINKKREEIQKQ